MNKLETHPYMTEEQWNNAIPKVVKSMTDYLKPFRVPVFEDLGGHGKGWGSGSFIQLGDRVFILTNEHVAKVRLKNRKLIYQLLGREDLIEIKGNHCEQPYPIDLALLPIDMNSWGETSNNSRAISLGQISLAHTPVDNEIFTFTGFSGQNTRFLFNRLLCTATCYTAQEVALPIDKRFNCRFHLGLDYNPNNATDVVGSDGLPMPPGLSGSTLWNTGYVEAMNNGCQWQPEMATVTGVIWGWPSSNGHLLATRSEYLSSFLLQALSKMERGEL